MFYRRKIILAIMQAFKGELDKIRLQKLLFMVSERQQSKAYDFIPYKYGCFSYSANADLGAMVKKGLLSETETHFKREDKIDYLHALNDSDRKIVKEVIGTYGAMSANALMKHTYINFPFWAVNSLKAKSLLNEQEYEKVLNAKNEDNSTTLFTIGYEGVSPEAYLNKLIKNNVHVLVDVRKNALSMKYGFSKSHLKRFCESIGIEYIHLPEVGIQSDKRQTLVTQKDYDLLFEDYKSTCLPSTQNTQNQILNILKEKHRIALTCFESNICQCHRKPLSEAITQLPGFKYELKHI
ncbi:MAG: DUF488 family protein [Bacteroidota bacterium]